MILKKFLVFALISLLLVDAAPAGVNESGVAKDDGETSPATTDAASTVTETAATDSSQNEVDVKFAAEDLETTTMSDIDEKIESIESDGAEKKINEAELQLLPKTIEISAGSALPVNEKLIELTTESDTKEEIKVTAMSTELPKEADVTTAAVVEKAEEELVDVQELENNNELRKLEAEELFTTEAISQPSSTADAQTTTEVTPPSRQSDERISSQSLDLTARRKALERIRNMLRAKILRNVLALLNDARSRQNMQTHDSPRAESQLIEDIVPAAAAASDCDCGTENDDVSTNDDDDKIITFDENLQRYVYKEKKDYDMMNSSESRLDYVMRF